MKLATLAAAAIGAMTLGLAAQASATTVDFRFLEGAATVASGSFSYGDAETGVLGYSDLSSFDVTLFGETFTLADVQSTLTANDHFAYDTAAGDFVNDGLFSDDLSATTPDVSQGFYFANIVSPAGDFEDIGLDRSGGFTDVVFTTGSAPEPAVWALMIAGLGVAGGALRLRSRAGLA